MSTTGTTTRRVAAGVSAVALALTGAMAMSTAAHAVTGPAPGQPDAPTTGSLTINKYSGGNTETPDVDNLLDGVEFTVTEVGRLAGENCLALDLTESAAWDGLPDLFKSAPAAPADAFCLRDAVFTDVTAAGQATFDLPVGIYFAEETDPGDHPIISAVPNFYVSIPTSEGAAGEGWNYDVVADPKNQLAEKPVKTITDHPDIAVLGGKVTWDLTVPIPTLNADDSFTISSVTDSLPAELAYTGSTVSIGKTVLKEKTDYLESDNITWTFEEAGLTALAKHQGQDLVIRLETEVTAVTKDGDIANSKYSSTFNNATVSGDQIPYTYWGQLKIQKNDDSIPVRGLEGAEFQVFEKSANPCAVTAPATGAVATGTSNAAGEVKWGEPESGTTTLGLWVANSNNGPAGSDPAKDYCLYETVVPTGHVAGAIENPVTIIPGNDNVAELTVVNPKKSGPELPLTGSTGTLLMTLGGAATVLVGAGSILVSRRRSAGSL